MFTKKIKLKEVKMGGFFRLHPYGELFQKLLYSSDKGMYNAFCFNGAEDESIFYSSDTEVYVLQ